MKKLMLVVSLLLVSSQVRADSWKDVFSKTEGSIVDFAIASSVEPGYFRDMIEGRNAVGAQSPIVYVTPYLNADWGYVTGYEAASRGSLMVGGTLRVNKLLEDLFKGNVGLVRQIIPTIDSNWDRLWFGPFVAHSFLDENFMAGLKAGLSF